MNEDNVKIRVLTVSQTDTTFVIEVATSCLAYFNKYFDIKYPLPKLDLVALPELSPGKLLFNFVLNMYS